MKSPSLTETTSPDLEDDMGGRGTAKTVDELLALTHHRADSGPTTCTIMNDLYEPAAWSAWFIGRSESALSSSALWNAGRAP